MLMMLAFGAPCAKEGAMLTMGSFARDCEQLMLMMLAVWGTLGTEGAADAHGASPLPKDGEKLMLMMLVVLGTLGNMHLLMFMMLAIRGSLRKRGSC